MGEREKTFLKLVADNEQDTSAAKKWWAEESLDGKMKVWDAIQAMPDDGLAGLVCRLAQLKFAELAEQLG